MTSGPGSGLEVQPRRASLGHILRNVLSTQHFSSRRPSENLQFSDLQMATIGEAEVIVFRPEFGFGQRGTIWKFR